MKPIITRVVMFALLGGAALAVVLDDPEPQWMQVGVRYGRRVMVPTNQILDPAGRRIEFTIQPVDMALNPARNMIAVLLQRNIQLFTMSGQPSGMISIRAASMAGVAFTPDGEWVVASEVEDGDSIAIADVRRQHGVAHMRVPPRSTPVGLAFDPGGANLFVALSRMNALGRLDISAGSVVETVPVGVAPFGVAVTPSGDRVFVTNSGGRRALRGEITANSSGTATLVNEAGVAMGGSVSVVDAGTFRVIAEIPVGIHPTGIQISPDGRLAAVANSNSDTVTFIDTESLSVVQTVDVPAIPKGFVGSSPTAIAFGADGRWVYVTCGGNNAVAVLEREENEYKLRGFVPTDWYPVAVAAYQQGGEEHVVVLNGKGIGAVNIQARRWIGQATGTLNLFEGRVASIASEDALLARNVPFRNATIPDDSPQDLRELGVEHVFLVIKENRTYDQVLGDLGRGRGRPEYATYGWDVTPNHHELAQRFVTLDNFYTSGRLSVDGHQWLTQAMVTAYLERAHTKFPRSYPYNGDDPLAFSPAGFLWTRARDAGLTARVYGEFALPASPHSRSWIEYLRDAESPQQRLVERSTTAVASLAPILEPNYPSFAMNIPDTFRVRVFLEQFEGFVRRGDLPNLVIIQLPADHTAGTSPGGPSPRAMVADNDLAIGRLVQAISFSPYWGKSAIFITEDDAQDGWDHVDGHRTVCLVVSPYVRRATVDSVQYNQTSILRTIEELLGMKPLTKFDAAAMPMRSVFMTVPQFAPYSIQPNRVPLDEMNPRLAALGGKRRQAALLSAAMNFSVPDAAPEQTLNRILWHHERGWARSYPRVPHGPQCLLDDDDDEGISKKAHAHEDAK